MPSKSRPLCIHYPSHITLLLQCLVSIFSVWASVLSKVSHVILESNFSAQWVGTWNAEMFLLWKIVLTHVWILPPFPTRSDDVTKQNKPTWKSCQNNWRRQTGSMKRKWSSLGLSKAVLETLKELKFKTMTPVQVSCFVFEWQLTAVGKMFVIEKGHHSYFSLIGERHKMRFRLTNKQDEYWLVWPSIW